MQSQPQFCSCQMPLAWQAWAMRAEARPHRRHCGCLCCSTVAEQAYSRLEKIAKPKAKQAGSVSHKIMLPFRAFLQQFSLDSFLWVTWGGLLFYPFPLREHCLSLNCEIRLVPWDGASPKMVQSRYVFIREIRHAQTCWSNADISWQVTIDSYERMAELMQASIRI